MSRWFAVIHTQPVLSVVCENRCLKHDRYLGNIFVGGRHRSYLYISRPSALW